MPHRRGRSRGSLAVHLLATFATLVVSESSVNPSGTVETSSAIGTSSTADTTSAISSHTTSRRRPEFTVHDESSVSTNQPVETPHWTPRLESSIGAGPPVSYSYAPYSEHSVIPDPVSQSQVPGPTSLPYQSQSPSPTPYLPRTTTTSSTNTVHHWNPPYPQPTASTISTPTYPLPGPTSTHTRFFVSSAYQQPSVIDTPTAPTTWSIVTGPSQVTGGTSQAIAPIPTPSVSPGSPSGQDPPGTYPGDPTGPNPPGTKPDGPRPSVDRSTRPASARVETTAAPVAVPAISATGFDAPTYTWKVIDPNASHSEIAPPASRPSDGSASPPGSVDPAPGPANSPPGPGNPPPAYTTEKIVWTSNSAVFTTFIVEAISQQTYGSDQGGATYSAGPATAHLESSGTDIGAPTGSFVIYPPAGPVTSATDSPASPASTDPTAFTTSSRLGGAEGNHPPFGQAPDSGGDSPIASDSSLAPAPDSTGSSSDQAAPDPTGTGSDPAPTESGAAVDPASVTSSGGAVAAASPFAAHPANVAVMGVLPLLAVAGLIA